MSRKTPALNTRSPQDSQDAADARMAEGMGAAEATEGAAGPEAAAGAAPLPSPDVAPDAPATEAMPSGDMTPAPLADPAPSATDAGGPVGADDAGLMVLCLAAGGKRRAGRRWPQGLTGPVTDLDEVRIAQLQADPHFQIARR
ncbi:hypothetical protein [Gemmobacter denitrificans]|uniref:Mu-like prophage FluMu N-terminal domain-containing protein n=1 Tax=Gemmobacter denitrificans TaxID=3123040 RepID=A0ABU8C0T5_9RHOB